VGCRSPVGQGWNPPPTPCPFPKPLPFRMNPPHRYQRVAWLLAPQRDRAPLLGTEGAPCQPEGPGGFSILSPRWLSAAGTSTSPPVHPANTPLPRQREVGLSTSFPAQFILSPWSAALERVSTPPSHVPRSLPCHPLHLSSRRRRAGRH